MDSSRSSPSNPGPLRRAKSDAHTEAGVGLRLHSVRALALAFLCGALYAVCMTALSSGGLAAWREGACRRQRLSLPKEGGRGRRV